MTLHDSVSRSPQLAPPQRLFLRRVCFIPIKPLSSLRRCLRPPNSTTGDDITDQEHHSSGAILVPVVASTSSFFRLTREPMEFQAHDAHELACNSS
ncbi:hypothetical protein F2Q68_00034366 [Brassica cretica]|uniref:Uncharacterized protein n=1 Tax=Brassica cretica TaxID=69181 RepID=A0A8S9H368_BRACR|nr:hypothetical protein F2Q68_00034366 [Brassica cretica]